MKRTNLLRGFGVVGCLALTLVWAMLALSGGALADPPQGGEHDHGGGGGGGGGGGDDVPVLFDVTTLMGSDIQIIGFIDPEDGVVVPGAQCLITVGPVEGRADKSTVLVNRPSAALQMDFLTALTECSFTEGTIYCGGTIQIGEKNSGAWFVFFFQALGLDGGPVSYRLDADAEILSDGGNTFPRGEPVGDGYTVCLTNLEVSVDTGPHHNGCEHTFPGPDDPGEVFAIIRLDRIQ
ncbi:MAG: hypothetical protein V3W34_12310 [Phycisphaerae bacterium]